MNISSAIDETCGFSVNKEAIESYARVVAKSKSLRSLMEGSDSSRENYEERVSEWVARTPNSLLLLGAVVGLGVGSAMFKLEGVASPSITASTFNQTALKFGRSEFDEEVRDLSVGMTLGNGLNRDEELRELASEVVRQLDAAGSEDIRAWAAGLAKDLSRFND